MKPFVTFVYNYNGSVGFVFQKRVNSKSSLNVFRTASSGYRICG